MDEADNLGEVDDLDEDYVTQSSSRASAADELITCKDEHVLAVARDVFGALASSRHSADVLVLVARHSRHEPSSNADVFDEQLDHLIELFADWRRRFDDGRD